MSGCDVHNGLRCVDKLLVLPGAISHREAGLHGVELIPGLDLRHGQRHRRAMMDTMKGDLLDVGWDVMEASIDEGALGVDDHHSHVRRQLNGLQLHRQS